MAAGANSSIKKDLFNLSLSRCHPGCGGAPWPYQSSVHARRRGRMVVELPAVGGACASVALWDYHPNGALNLVAIAQLKAVNVDAVSLGRVRDRLGVDVLPQERVLPRVLEHERH